jgi:hypothetical protein
MKPLLFINCRAFLGVREDEVHKFFSVFCKVDPMSFVVRKDRGQIFGSIYGDDTNVAHRILQRCMGLRFRDGALFVRPWTDKPAPKVRNTNQVAM